MSDIIDVVELNPKNELMTMLSHIEFDTLADFVEGKIAAEHTQEVARTLKQADSETLENARWLNRFHDVVQHVSQNPTPDRVREAVMREFKAQHAAKRGPGLLQSVLALLTFDSGMGLATAGIRSAILAGDQRMLVYSSDAVDIAINIQRTGSNGKVGLSGQVLTNKKESMPDEFIVQLIANDSEIGITEADDNGDFIFSSVELGKYQLCVTSLAHDVITPSFSI